MTTSIRRFASTFSGAALAIQLLAGAVLAAECGPSCAPPVDASLTASCCCGSDCQQVSAPSAAADATVLPEHLTLSHSLPTPAVIARLNASHDQGSGASPPYIFDPLHPPYFLLNQSYRL